MFLLRLSHAGWSERCLRVRKAGDLAGVELMRDGGGCGEGVHGTNLVAESDVDGRGALAGAEVVEPGFHDEGLVEEFGVLGVAEDAPPDGSVAEADVAELVDGAGELGVAGNRDGVLDGDADGSGEWGFVGEAVDVGELRGRILPLVRGEVGHGAAEDVEAEGDG